jgi:hypothetical protein
MMSSSLAFRRRDWYKLAINSSQLSLAYPVLPAPAHCEPDTKDSHYQPAPNEYLIILTLYLLLIKEVTLLHR